VAGRARGGRQLGNHIRHTLDCWIV
jgi:hypothetical protein